MIQLCFKLVPKGKWHCSRGVDTKWFGIFGQSDVEPLAVHGFDLSIEGSRIFELDVEGGTGLSLVVVTASCGVVFGAGSLPVVVTAICCDG